MIFALLFAAIANAELYQDPKSQEIFSISKCKVAENRLANTTGFDFVQINNFTTSDYTRDAFHISGSVVVTNGCAFELRNLTTSGNGTKNNKVSLYGKLKNSDFVIPGNLSRTVIGHKHYNNSVLKFNLNKVVGEEMSFADFDQIIFMTQKNVVLGQVDLVDDKHDFLPALVNPYASTTTSIPSKPTGTTTPDVRASASALSGSFTAILFGIVALML